MKWALANSRFSKGNGFGGPKQRAPAENRNAASLSREDGLWRIQGSAKKSAVVNVKTCFGKQRQDLKF